MLCLIVMLKTQCVFFTGFSAGLSSRRLLDLRSPLPQESCRKRRLSSESLLHAGSPGMFVHSLTVEQLCIHVLRWFLLAYAVCVEFTSSPQTPPLCEEEKSWGGVVRGVGRQVYAESAVLFHTFFHRERRDPIWLMRRDTALLYNPVLTALFLVLELEPLV